MPQHNTVIMPFYQLLLFVPVLLGMAGLFVVPGLKDSNQVLFAMISKAMPTLLLGLIGAGGRSPSASGGAQTPHQSGWRCRRTPCSAGAS